MQLHHVADSNDRVRVSVSVQYTEMMWVESWIPEMGIGQWWNL